MSGSTHDERHVGNHRLADDGKLFPERGIIDDRELRHVGGGTRGRRNADEGRPGDANVVDTLEIGNRDAVRAYDTDGFCAVHRTAAADRDDDVAPIFPIKASAFHCLKVARILVYVGKKRILNFFGFKLFLNWVTVSGRFETNLKLLSALSHPMNRQIRRYSTTLPSSKPLFRRSRLRGSLSDSRNVKARDSESNFRRFRFIQIR